MLFNVFSYANLTSKPKESPFVTILAYWNKIILKMETIIFQPDMTYYCHHKPSGENWLILGVNIEKDEVCAAGWPPSIGRLSDCEGFEERHLITDEEKDHRSKQFGYNWL